MLHKTILTGVVLCAYIAWLGLDVDGKSSKWSKWTPCSLSCGGGTRFRVRSQTNPASANGGQKCTGGYKVENQTCNSQPCPVNGIFTEWSNWTSCSLSCGNGTRYRSRSCTKP
ncbi:mucin-like protein, partial [Exaiptasia diaphana]|uniref:Uncharacterized protein n=1 Tax=Exaiptasia diaphana TaxID=2652724 RepID=A0A913YTK6_EXADI